MSRESGKGCIMAKPRRKSSVSVSFLANPTISLRPFEVCEGFNRWPAPLCKFSPHSKTQVAAPGGMLDGLTREVFWSMTSAQWGRLFLIVHYLVACQRARVVHRTSLSTGTQRGVDGVKKGMWRERSYFWIKGGKHLWQQHT